MTRLASVFTATVCALALVGCSSISDAGRAAERRASATSRYAVFPAYGASRVNPDTLLKITLPETPVIGKKGKVRIFDAATMKVVDELDLSIPSSPRPEGRMKNADGSTTAPVPPKPAGPDNPGFQYQLIGGTYFHFFPIIVRGNTATIYPHHGKLQHGKEYLVRLDPGVLSSGGVDVAGLPGAEWKFTTRADEPLRDGKYVVAADGTADFTTVQGAIDFAETNPAKPVEVFIRNGRYEELVVINDRSNLTVRGEDRSKVVVGYPNNSAFNRTRPAFMVTKAKDVQLSTFTIENYFIGQAEALLVNGEHIVIDRMTLNGSGDAFTTRGTIYMVDSSLTGDGDTILGYAALYCLRCEIRSVGPFTWTRTPKGSHGNVFVDSTFIYLDKPLPWSITETNPAGTKTPGTLARLPRNGPPGSPSANFPYAEMVLINSRLDGIPDFGWGPVEEDGPNFSRANIRFYEYGSTDMQGAPVDTSSRHPVVRQLSLPADARLIADYRDPAFVLNGWRPVVR